MKIKQGCPLGSVFVKLFRSLLYRATVLYDKKVVSVSYLSVISDKSTIAYMNKKRSGIVVHLMKLSALGICTCCFLNQVCMYTPGFTEIVLQIKSVSMIRLCSESASYRYAKLRVWRISVHFLNYFPFRLYI